MDLVYSPHAVDRMQSRKISVSEVEEIVSDPDGKIPQSRSKMIYVKHFSKRKDNSLAVVVVDQGNQLFEVITVMNNFEVKR